MDKRRKIIQLFERILRVIQDPTRRHEDILSEILRRAAQFVGADRGDLALWSEHKGVLIVGAVYGETPHAFDQKGQPIPKQSVTMSLWEDPNQRCRIIEDISTSRPSEYWECNPRTVTEVALRLKFSNRSLGVMNFEFFRVRKFRREDQQALLVLADWVSTAVQLLIQQMSLQGMLDTPPSGNEYKESFLTKLLDTLRAAYGFDAGVIYIVDKAQSLLRCAAYMDTSKHAVSITKMDFPLDGHSIASKVVRDRDGYFCENPQRDAAVDKNNIIAVTINGPLVAVPLLSEHTVIGVLVVWSRNGPAPGPQHKELLSPFAKLASLHVMGALGRWQDHNLAVLRAMESLSDEGGLDLAGGVYRQVIFEGLKSRGIARGRVFIFKPTQRKLVCVASFDGCDEDIYRGRASTLDKNPYAKHIAKHCSIDASAKRYDPLNPIFFGPDPTAARFGKPADLPWAAVALVVDGELYGQITADNRFRHKPITQETLEYMTLLGNLVSRTLTQAKRKQEAEKLRKSEELYHSLVENLKQSVFCKDKEGRFTFVNRHFCKTIGKKSKEIIGKKDSDLFPTKWAKKYRADDWILLSGKKPVLDVEEPHPSRDGNLRYVRVIKIPVLDSFRRIVGVQGIFFDITERKRLAVQMDSLLKAIPDSIYFKGRNSQFLRINPAMKRRLKIKRLIKDDDFSDFDVFEEKNAQAKFEAEKRIMETGKPIINLVEEEVLLNGKRRWVLTTKVPLRDHLGNIIGTCGISKEITEIKCVQDKLKKANAALAKAKKELEARVLQRTKDLQRLTDALTLAAIGISNPHDILKPLSRVGGLAELAFLNLKRNDLSELKKCLEIIKACAYEGAKGIRAVLDAAKLGKIKKSPMDLTKCVKDWLTSIKFHFLEKHTDPFFDCKEDAIMVPMQPQILRVAFTNVCLNSAREINNNDRVTVSVFRRPCNEVVIEIADSGPGFPKGFLDTSSVPFSTAFIGKRQGLGLTITQRVLQLHNGKMELAETSGGGATVRLILPTH